MNQVFQVGVITTTHGIGGAVKVFPTTDEPARFKRLKQVWISESLDAGSLLEIEQVSFFKQMVILKFKGMDNINEVLRLKGKPLYVPRDKAVPCKKGEYYIADLLGMEVFEEGSRIGVVDDVLQTGANDVYVVKEDSGRELLLPAIRDCILEIHVEENRMDVHVLEGLR